MCLGGAVERGPSVDRRKAPAGRLGEVALERDEDGGQVGLSAAAREAPAGVRESEAAADEGQHAALDRNRCGRVRGHGQLRVERRHQRVAEHAGERGRGIEEAEVAWMCGMHDPVAQQRGDRPEQLLEADGLREVEVAQAPLQLLLTAGGRDGQVADLVPVALQ